MKREYGLGRKTVNKDFLLYFTETDETTINYNQSDCLIQRICAATRPILATSIRQLDDMWMGKPVYILHDCFPAHYMY